MKRATSNDKQPAGQAKIDPQARKQDVFLPFWGIAEGGGLGSWDSRDKQVLSHRLEALRESLSTAMAGRVGGTFPEALGSQGQETRAG